MNTESSQRPSAMLRFSPIYAIAITSGLLVATLASGVHAAQPTATLASQDGQVEVPEYPLGNDIAVQQLLNLEPQLLAQQQQSKVALVIGNAAYEDDPLANPINDATAIHQALDELGFDVLPLVTNANKQEMLEAIDDFHQRLEEGAVGVFYYAGHGVQVDGINYLVPLGAALEREAHAEFDAVPINRVIREMNDAGTSSNILIVDACRDNPFYRRWRLTRGSNIRGLSTDRPPRGTLIAYATEPNDVAEDGDDGDRHSPYTQSLLTHLRASGISIFDMLTLVADDVLQATNDRQSPYFEGNLRGYFSFNPTQPSSLISTSTPTPSPIPQPVVPPVSTPTPTPSPTPSPTPRPNPPVVELPVETSLDLTQLRSFAQAGNWQQADEETSALLLQLGDENGSGWLNSTEVEALSCSDLRAIDQVWSAASDGRFGFSAQAQIWQEVGSPTEYNEQWEEFGDRVGWRKDGNWIINYDQLLFDTTAPDAHLPTFSRHFAAFWPGEINPLFHCVM